MVNFVTFLLNCTIHMFLSTVIGPLCTIVTDVQVYSSFFPFHNIFKLIDVTLGINMMSLF